MQGAISTKRCNYLKARDDCSFLCYNGVLLMVCPKHGDAYGIRWRTAEDKMLRLNRSCGPREPRRSRDGHVQQTVIFQNPACLFQLDRVY